MNLSPIILLILVSFATFTLYYSNIQVNKLNYKVTKSTKAAYFLACGVLATVLVLIGSIQTRLIVTLIAITLLNRLITKNSYVFSAILSVYTLLIINLSGSLAVLAYTTMARVSANEFSTTSDYLFYHIISLLIFVAFVKLSRHKVADMDKTLWSTGTKIGAFAVISSIPVFIIMTTLLPMFQIISRFPGHDELVSQWMFFSFFILLVLGLYLTMSVYLVILYSRNKEMSQLDAMTGALTKEVGIKFIEESMDRARVRNNNLVVCFVDIDNLKMVNDTLGHKEGDLLIQTVVDTIQAMIRITDKVIRFGGDEFIIVFREMDVKKAKDIVERIGHKLSEISETKAYHLGVSYGLAEYVHSKYSSVHDFISEADKDMYAFKRKHKKLRYANMDFQQLEIPYDIEVPLQANR